MLVPDPMESDPEISSGCFASLGPSFGTGGVVSAEELGPVQS